MAGKKVELKENLTFDISEEDAPNYAIGDSVRIVIEGTVGMVQEPMSGVTKDNPPILGVRVTSKTITPLGDEQEAEIKKLTSDDDEDD